MNITYVAKHGSGGNDDEGAIAYALKSLGHNVECVREHEPSRRPAVIINNRCELLLFHKWLDAELLPQVRCPKVFWYFDLVDFQHPDTDRLTRVRTKWMSLATELVDLGFCTDGDWVNRDTSDKLVRLTQGADERVAGRRRAKEGLVQVIFPGSIEYGVHGRKSFVHLLRSRYGNRFQRVHGTYRESLANKLATARIVVAPDTPVSNDYWSNRVYVTLGFGSFLLHPYCKTLESQYEDGKEIVLYRDRDHLIQLVDHYLENSQEREIIQQAAARRTEKEHLYRHRCESLLSVIKERLG